MKMTQALSCVTLAILLTTTATNASQYDALVFYLNGIQVASYEAQTPGVPTIVPQLGLANPNAIQQVILYAPDADPAQPFLADVFGVVGVPDDQQVINPILFLIDSFPYDPNAPSPFSDPVFVPDLPGVDVYDATGFLEPSLIQEGYTLKYEQGIKEIPRVPDSGSTLVLLSLGLGGILGFLRRK